MPKSFYGVRVGLKPGIYRNWPEAKAQVDGFQGAVFKGFDTEAEAREFVGVADKPVMISAAAAVVPVQSAASIARHAKQEKASRILGIQLPIRIQPAVLPVLERIPRDESDLHTLHVDGGHNRQTGKEGWGRVVDAKGVDLFAPHVFLFPDYTLRDVILPVMGASYVCVSLFKDMSKGGALMVQQNNGGELLALVAGLRIAEHYKDKVKVIGSDSAVVLFWSKTLGAESRAKMDPRKAAYIDECILLRRKFEASGGQVIKISGDSNRADLGYH